ncbi:MAG: tyrosine-type recombinase/integrase [Candidatus Moraniibacteriota bacterium]
MKKETPSKENRGKTQIQELARQFGEHLEIEMNRSQRTVDGYARVLEAFFQEMGLQKPSDISLETVRRYRLHLNRRATPQGGTLKKNTQSYHAIVIRSFLKFLAKQDIETLAAEKVEVGKIPDREVDFLEFDEVERLIEATSGTTAKALRDRAIIELLFSSGLRVSELTSLDRYHVNLEKGEFSVRGKGQKLRIVFLSDAAKRLSENTSTSAATWNRRFSSATPKKASKTRRRPREKAHALHRAAYSGS